VPQEAISFIEREAEPYDEEAVKENMGSKKEQETLPCGCPGTMARSRKGSLKLIAMLQASLSSIGRGCLLGTG
jgi:hypothetical protein